MLIIYLRNIMLENSILNINLLYFKLNLISQIILNKTMNEINTLKKEEYNFRQKRTENGNESRKTKKNGETNMKNIYQDNIFTTNENLNTYNIQNDNEKNKYPDFNSFLQIHPKDNIEIPSIKYYNYIFNIGSPLN